MCDDFARLFCCETVVHSFVQVESNLRYLASCNESGRRDETPVARCKIRPQPKVTEQNVGGVLHESRSDLAELLFYIRRTLLLGGLIERKQLSSGSSLGVADGS